jgi:integrase/recombinase XerD
MRNRGYKYTSQSAQLRFVHFLQLNLALQDQPVGVMLEHWAAAKATRNHAAECDNLRRTLKKIFRHRDPSIPPRRPDPRPHKEVVKQWRKPHIYSPADVQRMLDIARSYPSPRAPLRPLTIYIMLLLAYCAGLRRGELARLDLGDVDLQSDKITVRQSKFFKTRILPLPNSVMVEPQAYINARRRAGASQDPRSGLLWHEQGRTFRYTPAMITWLFNNVIRRAGLKSLQGRTGPRLHDLRHLMVVNRILEWYRVGIDSAHIPPHHFRACRARRARRHRASMMADELLLPKRQPFPVPRASFPDWPSRSGWWCQGSRGRASCG